MFDFKNYHEALSVDEAVRLLAELPNTQAIAGGSDILIKLRDEPEPDCELIGLSRIEELKEIEMDEEGVISIGAMATFDQLEKDELVMKYLPVLWEAGGTIGGPQLRRMATLGGNVCNGAVSADAATPLFCYNAKLEIATMQGHRIVPVDEFYLGPGKTNLKKGELLVNFLFEPDDYRGFTGTYIKFSRRKALDIANLGVTTLCRTEGGRFSEVRIALGVAAPVPIRCPRAEAYARGKMITPDELEAIGRTAVADARPRDSWRASKAFRQQLIEVCTARALKNSLDKREGA